MTQTSGKLITRNYAAFRGVDFSDRQDEVNLYRSPDALNMWKNYKRENGKCIETRPDVELLAEYSNTISGLFFYGEGYLVHSGTKLYNGDTEIYSNMAEHKSNYFVYRDKVYIQDGTNYLVWDGSTVKSVEEDAYVPRTTISKPPSGGGVIYQDVNLLSPYRRNDFCSDGASTDYVLDAQNIDEEQVRVWITNANGQMEELTSGFTTNYEDGVVTFDTAPAVPYTDGQDNVFIQYKKTVTGTADKIKKCTLVEIFDNRVFMSGNPDMKNVVWHSSLEDPSYFSDTDYYEEGSSKSAVKGMVAGNNAIWILKEPSVENTTIFYHNPSIDENYGKVYPNVHSSISTGCVSEGINFRDTICFLSPEGLEAITGDVTTEQVITHKSSLIDSRLLNEDLSRCRLVEIDDYLAIVIDNKMYLADSRQYSQVNDHYEYEWYYFEFDQNIDCEMFCTDQGEDYSNSLVMGTNEEVKVDGVKTTVYRLYSLNNYSNNRKVTSYWCTIEDEFNYPQYQKITNKKGCVFDLEGEAISIYAEADHKGFSLIKTFKQVPKGYIVPRIKKKKWKSIQLKFYSEKPFSLYSGTLESYVGSYIKR